MTYKMINTSDYLLVVDDSEIKVGDWFFEKAGRLGPICFNEGKVNFHMKKIIAHLPLNNSSILEGVDLLPPLEQEDDVEKMAIVHATNPGMMTYVFPDKKESFIIGYNKAKEKYKYTEKDMKYMFECGRNYQNNAEVTFKVSMDYLLQTKIPVGFERKETIVLTNQGQTVWVGKYIF